MGRRRSFIRSLGGCCSSSSTGSEVAVESRIFWVPDVSRLLISADSVVCSVQGVEVKGRPEIQSRVAL